MTFLNYGYIAYVVAFSDLENLNMQIAETQGRTGVLAETIFFPFFCARLNPVLFEKDFQNVLMNKMCL